MRIIRTQSILAALFVFFFSHLCAQTPSITLSLQQTSQLKKANGSSVAAVPTNKNFTIAVTVKDGSGTVEVDGINNFQVIGQSQSRSMVNANGSQTVQETLFLTARAPREGSYTLGPAKMTIEGKAITSNTVTLEVNNKAQPPAQTAQQTQGGSQTNVFGQLAVDQTRIVVGQPITLTFTIYTQGPLLGLQAEQPTFTDCLAKEIKQTKAQSAVQFKNSTYQAQEKTFILFPTKAGELTINPFVINYAVPIQKKRHGLSVFDEDFFNSFFGHRSEEKNTQTNDLTITVLPLPAHSGTVDSVGSFSSFNATVDKHEAVTNEPIKLTLTIEGKGNLDQIAMPKLSLPDHFKYYDSKTSIHEDLETAYTGGKKQCEYVIQVNRAGTCQIPAQTFTFYDTQIKAYRTLTTMPIDLTIKQGAAPALQPKNYPDDQPDTDEQATPPATAPEDIHFIIEDAPATQHPITALPLWLLLILLCAPALLINPMLVRHLQGMLKKLAGNPTFKTIAARSNAELEQLIKQKDARALHQLFIKFFAARANITRSFITEDWIEQYLHGIEWQRDKIHEFLSFMSACAQLHFSGASSAHQTADPLFKKAQYWLLILSEK